MGTEEEVTPWNKVKTAYSNKDKGDGTAWMEVPGGRLYQHWIAHRTGCSVSTSFVPTDRDAAALRLEIKRLQTQIETLGVASNAQQDEWIASRVEVKQLKENFRALEHRACNCAMRETQDAGGHSTTCPVREDFVRES